MFLGALNGLLRDYLASQPEVFRGRTMVVGCSGNFTLESLLLQVSEPREIHSNDVSIYSCMIGRWMAEQDVDIRLIDDRMAWLEPHLQTDTDRLAALLVLQDMLPYEKQKHPHNRRMWEQYHIAFPTLHAATVRKLETIPRRLTSFYAGDIFDHYNRFADDPNAIFFCYAPIRVGDYENLYKRLDALFAWDAPTYTNLDRAARDRLAEWVKDRPHVWLDDGPLPGWEPVLFQRLGKRPYWDVYGYSNVLTKKALFVQAPGTAVLPNRRLADETFVLNPGAKVRVEPIPSADMTAYKDVFLLKTIVHTAGDWPFAIVIDGVTVGFFEVKPGKYSQDGLDLVYLQSDFPVSYTRYAKLSKLVLMILLTKDTRRLLERIAVRRVRKIVTTAWTERPSSMKYRGVMKLANRNVGKDGRHLLNYRGVFSEKTWQQAYQEWLTKYGSDISSKNSTMD